MSEELKPCPFCGECDFVIMSPLYTYVACAECNTDGPSKPTRAEAITAWNTRAGEKA